MCVMQKGPPPVPEVPWSGMDSANDAGNSRPTRRDTSWSSWCADVLSVAVLAPTLSERASHLLSRFTPSEAAARELSRAYDERTRHAARRALRAAIQSVSVSSSDMFTANACVLVTSELMLLELDEQDDLLESLDRHGVDADQVVWANGGHTLREPDTVMETRALLLELLALPEVRPEVWELAQDAAEGVRQTTLSQDLRRLWSNIEGRSSSDTSAGPTAPGPAHALSTLLSEFRALRSDLARRASPYQAGNDWLEDVISTLPPLLEQADAAKALGVDPRTIRRMIARGELNTVDVGDGGRGRSCGVRVPRGALADFLRRKAGRTQGRST